MNFSRSVLIPALGMLWISTLSVKGQDATTQAATGVTDIAATMNGSVTPGSASTYYSCWFEYGLTSSYGTRIEADHSPVTGLNPIGLKISPRGLLPNTTYHYRVAMDAREGGGTKYLGADMTFTTGPPSTLPSFISVSPDIISDTSVAILIDSSRSGGSTATLSIEYGADATYGSVFISPDTIPTNDGESYLRLIVTGLTPSTPYHWRFKLTNGQGSVYSADSSVTTLAAPILTTGNAGDLTYTSAFISGTVNPTGHPLAVSVQYGTGAYTTRMDCTPYSVSGTASIPVSTTLGSLFPGTTYHYRLSAFDSRTGIWYSGSDQTFTTPTALPATTQAATNITDLSATLNGTVYLGLYIQTSVNFEIGTTTSYGTVVQANPAFVYSTQPTAASFAASGLLPNTTYHYRVVAQDYYANTAFYGGDMTFTTGPPNTPPVFFQPPYSSNISITGVTASISLDGGSSLVTLLFDYGPTNSYGTTVTYVGTLPASTYSSVNMPIPGLVPGTTYHLRARATNNEGTATSSDITFTTASSPPDVTINPATYVGSSWARINGTCNLHGGSYTSTFDYGTSTAYGSSFAVTYNNGIIIIFGSGNTPLDFQADLSHLTPSSTYHYRLKLADNYGNVFYSADTTFTTVAPVEAWRQKYFSTTDGTGSRSDLANPSGDGIPNLLKYALGMDPAIQGSQPTPYLETVAGDGETYLTLRFSRVSVATDLTYQVQVTDNLAGAWTTIATSTGGTAFTGPGVFQDISYQDWLAGLGGYTNVIVIAQPPPPTFPGADYVVTIRDTVPTSQSAHRFMRLRVTR